MPYARKSFKRTSRGSRSNSGSRTRKAVRPPPQRKTRRTYVRKNSYAINRVSRKVNFLMEARYGQPQFSYQTCRGSPLITDKTPILWDLDDYTCLRTAPNPAGGTFQMRGCQVWTVNTAGTGIIAQPQVTDSGFITSPQLGGIYWDDTSRQLCGDTGYYRPIYCDYILEFDALDPQSNCSIRIDFVKQKRTVQAQPVDVPALSTSSVRMLPEGLVGMQDLATNKNHISPAFFKVIKTKWIMINNAREPSTNGSTAGRKFYKFRVWGKGTKNQLREAPGIPGTVEDTQASLQFNRSSRYGYTNTDAMRGYYIIVSTTDRTGGAGLACKITRFCKWRDPVGRAYL